MSLPIFVKTEHAQTKQLLKTLLHSLHDKTLLFIGFEKENSTHVRQNEIQTDFDLFILIAVFIFLITIQFGFLNQLLSEY